MTRLAQRTFLALLTLALAACSNPASPVEPAARVLKPGTTSHVGDYAPDGTYCISGYNVAQGRCN
jgi:hypothetical protein